MFNPREREETLASGWFMIIAFILLNFPQTPYPWKLKHILPRYQHSGSFHNSDICKSGFKYIDAIDCNFLEI